MAAFQKDIDSFERLDTQVLGVGPDDLQTHLRFSQSLGLTFPLISDPDGTLADLYGHGRVTFLIDKTGTVRHVVKGMPKNSELLAVIETFE